LWQFVQAGQQHWYKSDHIRGAGFDKQPEKQAEKPTNYRENGYKTIAV